MNKFLLPICAFMLSFAAANAQNVKELPGVKVESNPNVVPVSKSGSHTMSMLKIGEKSASLKQAPKKALTSDQKYIYNAGADQPLGGVGLPGYTPSKFGCSIASNVYTPYVGAKVVGMRFLTATSLKVTPKLYDVPAGANAYHECASAPELTTVASPENESGVTANWNEVTFTTPYELKSDNQALMLAFDYTQLTKKDSKGYTDDCYPFMASKNSNTQILAYGDLGQGEGWYNIGSGYTLCAQLIIQKDGGFPDDLAFVDIVTSPMVKTSEQLPVTFSLQNYGSKECTDYTFDVSIDNTDLGIMKSDGTGIGSTAVSLGTNIDLSSLNLADGVHYVTLKLNSVNGEAPSGLTDDDVAAAEFRVYSESTNRQYNLLEHFTSWTCVNCPYGYNVIRSLMKKRNDVAWVAIHGDYDSSNPDPSKVDDAQYIIQYSISGWPSANLNRFNLSGSAIGTGIGFTNTEYGANALSGVFDQEDKLAPSLVDLSMTSNLELGSNPKLKDGKLTITITGKGVKNASKILDTATLGLYITENGLTGNQYGVNNAGTAGEWKSNYSHENTLTVIGTDSPFGDQIVWNGDNFEKTYEVKIPKGTYNYSKGNTLNAVAFVSLPFTVEQDGKTYYNGDINNVWVNQCLYMPLNEGETTGVKAINGVDANATVVARYSADGTQLSAPVKGINILKMSDGTTRKVVVNK